MDSGTVRGGCGMTISAPSESRTDEQYTTREVFGLRQAEITEQRTAYRYRYLQQIRLLIWYMLAGFLVLPELFRQYFGDGRKRQRELIPRSLLIVIHMKRADGKKSELAFSIK